MGIQIGAAYCQNHRMMMMSRWLHSSSSSQLLCFCSQIGNNSRKNKAFGVQRSVGGRKLGFGSTTVVSSSSSSTGVAEPIGWDEWKPEKGSKSPPLSDVFWPAAGAFVAMAALGKMDQLLAPKGLSITIAPLGAVCAVLFASPSSPAARKYNVFMAQVGCAALGVLAFSVFGAGWLARGAGLAAAIAFMIYTRSLHPPAASLPLLFIDGAKLHGLNFWYAFFPGAAGCVLLCLIQELVCYLKDNFKF
ncbi:uncharacterized protein LOC127789564 isoform X2 [Diospyros lotus]|uniref:uncharacterized protein LOC127789564 isoform X2 n=1 Tax=Diospyros lotus TaxID=55363 RepID=UPI0022521FD9|nr:uncharacterized protein LOC127789564 isoform X2 [Diospyros lotus]